MTNTQKAAIERATPVQLRKSLEIANLFAKTGLRFVPMPCADDAEYVQLMQESIAKLDRLEAVANGAEVNGNQASGGGDGE